MSSQPANRRLSVSHMTRRPRREFTEAEIGVLRSVANTLIPRSGDKLGGGEVAKFSDLVTQATTILDSRFEMIEALLAELQSVQSSELWDYLKELDKTRNGDFYVLSLIVVAAYLSSDEMKRELAYPAPHQNPAGMFEIADELGSGILDPVIERGPIFVRAD